MPLEWSKRSWKLAFHDGSVRRPRVVAVPARDWDRFEREIEKERQALWESSRSKPVEKARRMAQWCGIGPNSSWMFAMELFGWRRFANRREVAAAVGLTPTPYQSGDSPKEQGISKAGNPRVRTMMIEIAWSWLRHQPDSVLSKWFWKRFLQGWLRRAPRSRLQPMQRVARMIRRHRDGVVGWVTWRIRNARLEGTNNKVRLPGHRSFGLHSAEALISLAYLCCGGLASNPVTEKAGEAVRFGASPFVGTVA